MMMMEALCDMDQPIGNWDLFMSPLLSDQPAVEHRRPRVLQGWGTYTSGDTSPVDEFLQDSIWQDSPKQSFGGPTPQTLKVEQISPDPSSALSPREDAIGQTALLDEDLNIDICDLFDSAAVHPLDQSSQNATDLNLDDLVYKVNISNSNGQQITPSNFHDYFKISSNEVHDYFKIGNDDVQFTTRELLGDNYDDDVLHDPHRVVDLLQSIDDSGMSFENLLSSPCLSPVSADEVDSVLLEHDTPVTDNLFVVSKSELTPPTHVNTISTVESQESQQSSAIFEVVPQSVEHSLDTNVYGVLSMEYEGTELTRKVVGRSRHPGPHDKVQKKKDQNKTAALRYRKKKKEEKGVVLSEVEQLELKNGELKEKVDDLNGKISYLRNLIDEIRGRLK